MNRRNITACVLWFAIALPAAAQGPPCAGLACQPVAVTADSPAAFLAQLNAERARWGRPPLAWDATLAAYASANTGVHQPGTSGGAAQCWSGLRSYTGALRQWLASPPHRAILLGATRSIGCALCPSGTTANAR